MRGQPPFKVYYLVQHGSQPPRTRVKSFTSTKGHIYEKPEREGDYTYTFTHVSDDWSDATPASLDNLSGLFSGALTPKDFVQPVGSL